MPPKKQLLESVLKKITPEKAEREKQGKLA